ELGIAHGIDKPTILVAKSPENTPFDVASRYMVLYSSEKELYNKLMSGLPALLTDLGDQPETGRTTRLGQLLLAEKGSAEDYEDELMKVASAYHDAALYPKAISLYEQLLARDSGSVDVLSRLGICYTFLGNLEKAIDAFQRAINLSPDDPTLLHNIGSVYYKRGDYGRSLHLLEQAKKFGSKNPQTLVYQGLSLWRLGRLSDAIDATTPVLAMTDETCVEDRHWIALAHNNIAYYLYDIEQTSKSPSPDRLKDAREHILEATRLEPNVSSYLDTLGCIQMWGHDFRNAKASFERSLMLRPSAFAAEHFAKVARILEEDV
ncbi:MAG: tetratricopeptide repeat protein, partial [candidate division Zixibacteria bacterium]|nr:tetratricopeptide repeat protein [candidate division Zixibacteria bacterium]